MKVNFDQTTGMVSWNIDDKDISMFFPNLLYAFKHGIRLVMVMEEDANSKESYSVYNIEGEFIFSYHYLDNNVRFMNKVLTLYDSQIIAADFDEVRNVLVVLNKSEEKEFLSLYNSNGEFLSSIPSPYDIKFFKLSNYKGNVRVIAHGLQEKSADKFGRNDWIFLINVDNYYVEKKKIIQL